MLRYDDRTRRGKALTAFESYQQTGMLLDLMLPGHRWLSGLPRIRSKHNTPIIMLSAKGEVFDKVLGLELGADDYVLKPFDSKELVAKSKSGTQTLSACQTRNSCRQPRKRLLTIRGIEINLTNYAVTVDGKNVDMPPKNWNFYFLASSPNQVFTHEQLLDQIWGYEYVGDTRTVDVHIKRLREKIKDHPSWGLSTVWGISYKFEVK